MTLLHEALRVLKLLPVICGGKDLVEEEDQWPHLPTSTDNENTVVTETVEELKQVNLREDSIVY